MAESDRSDQYQVEVDYERGAEHPERIFRAMADLVEAFERIDLHLAGSVSAAIQPVTVLQEIEAGSIRTWLATVIRSVDDDALKKLDWKQVIGTYLVRGKAKILKFLEDKNEITEPAQVAVLEAELVELAEETKVRHIPAYTPIPRRLLLADMNAVSAAVSPLNERESVVTVLRSERISVKSNFRISDAAIDRLLTERTVDSETEVILKIKKPDYLGNSMWEFRQDGHTVQARVTHAEWLNQFRSRMVRLAPGDAVRARLRTVINFDRFGETLETHREVTQVVEVILLPPGEQAEFVWDEPETAG